MNNKVNFLRGTATEYEASTKDNDTFYYTTDDEKLYLGNKEITGGGVTIDDTLSDASKNPVQNKVINAALNSKANLSDIPTALPANGGNADTVDGLHAASFLQNLGFWSTGSIKDLILSSSTSGTVFIDNTVSDMPVDNAYWFGFIDRKSTNIIARVVSINNKAKYSITYNGGLQTWYGWVNEADGGNAATLESHPASDFALKTDIPTSLPANGGRSDTTSHQIEHILGTGTDILAYVTSDNCPAPFNTIVRILHSPTCPTNYGYSASDNDFFYHIFKLDNSWATIKAFDIRGNVEFINSCLNGKWSGWVRSADGGNANTANLAGSFSSTPTNVCLRNLSSGTADVTTTNCPGGAWYGKHS